MPLTGPITRLVESPPNCPTRSIWTCACGVEADSIDISNVNDLVPSTIPGSLRDECTCPKCIGCGWTLDQESRCDNLDCCYCGLIIVIPD